MTRGIKSTAIILEISPNTGDLTKRLLEAGYSSDVLKTNLPYFDICVANIPYQISSSLTCLQEFLYLLSLFNKHGIHFS
ncbi:hypothetical protein SLE2022_262110 [Rubroshorea leprosula]